MTKEKIKEMDELRIEIWEEFMKKELTWSETISLTISKTAQAIFDEDWDKIRDKNMRPIKDRETILVVRDVCNKLKHELKKKWCEK